MRLDVDALDTPLGQLTAYVGAAGIAALDFGDDAGAVGRLERRFGGVELRPREDSDVRRALVAFFEGRLDALDDLPVDPGGTPYQRRVWEALRRIGPGRTTSYGALARALEPPSVARAVGAANGANPVAIVIPCHRVIGDDGALTGYAGGLWRKQWLLEHERGAAPQLGLF